MVSRRVTPTRADRRHKAAITRAARMGVALARVVRAAVRVAIDGLPERPGPHDLLRVRAHVADVIERMRHVLGERFRAMLVAAARREHWLSAVEFTRVANANGGNRGAMWGGGGVGVSSVFGGIRVGEAVKVQEDWRDYLKLIIPAPALDFLERIVGPVWRRVVGAINPQRASDAVLQGIAAGKDRREIAKDLEDVFGGYASGARRVARTAGLQVATQTQLAVSETIPELVAGYELNTVLDDRVRPEHRAAHGHKFYRQPTGQQRSLSDCPQPPIWRGQVHWNCRCYLIPIIMIDGEEV